jgi:2'-5' RNA ligase
MVALVPSVADAERLAVPGGEPADQMHCTLVFLGKAADIDAGAQAAIVDRIRSLVDDAIGPDYDLPVTAEGFSVAAFNPAGPEPCIVLGVTGAELEHIQGLVAEAVREAAADQDSYQVPGQHSPWIPHLTLAYTSDLSQVADLADRVGPVKFDRLRVAFGGVAIDIPLGPPAA